MGEHGVVADAGAADSLSAGHLTIYNTLDENGLLFDPPGQDWREHPVDH